jgi:hypothetical protein
VAKVLSHELLIAVTIAGYSINVAKDITLNPHLHKFKDFSPLTMIRIAATIHMYKKDEEHFDVLLVDDNHGFV